MNLYNFEEFIEPELVKRGLDYFKKGHVKSVEETKENTFKIKVDGSDIYTVNVVLGDDQSVKETVCNCPYDKGEYCKHKAAAFYALQNQSGEKGGITAPGELKEMSDIRSILSKKSKEELLDIIVNISESHRDVEQSIRFKYAPAKDDIPAIKKMIREYINKEKQRGFINWNRAESALAGAHMALERARARMEAGDSETAVNIGIAVLSIAVDMLQYTDDSNGSVGDVIRGSVAIIDQSALLASERLAAIEQKKLFDALLKESKHKRYDGWSEWAFDLLKGCTYLCGNPALRTKLELHLESLYSEGKGSSWRMEYSQNQIKLLQLEILERWDEPDAAEKFIKKHLFIDDIREKAINQATKEKDYQKVVLLCLEGEEKGNRGFKQTLKHYRYEAYEKMGDVQNMKELALDLVFENEFPYFLKLKQLYNPAEWAEAVDDILTKFKQKTFFVSIYESILIEEKRTGLLLEYCKRHPSYIERLYPHLIDEYLQEVNLLYIKFINEIAEDARDRKGYKKVCSKIKQYKKVCGEVSARLLIDSLKQKYARRPSFIDELGKVK